MARGRGVRSGVTRWRAMVLAAAALLAALPLSMPAAANGGGGGGRGSGGGPGPAAGGGGGGGNGGPGGGMMGRPLGGPGGGIGGPAGAMGSPGSMERGKPVGPPGTGGGISGPLGSPGGGSVPGRSFPGSGSERGAGGSGFGTGGSLFRGPDTRDPMTPPMGAGPSLPADATVHRFRGQQYFQSQGSWFVTRAGRLVTVPAPVGLGVESLPPAHETRWIDGVPYFVSGDAFYVWRERERKYEIVEPPAGGVRADGAVRDGSTATP